MKKIIALCPLALALLGCTSPADVTRAHIGRARID